MSRKEIVDVSIVCANYNNGKFLLEFIDSIVASSVVPRQLLIVDDGSTDSSLQVLEKFSLPFLNVIVLSKNQGFANALNTAIKKAKGKYVLRIDPDDIIEKTRIEEQYRFLETHEEIDIIGSNVKYFSENINHIVGSSNFPMDHEGIIKKYKKGEHGLLHGTVMAKTVLFKDNIYKQENVPAEDYDIFSRMIINGARPSSIDKILTYVRIHGGSVSNDLPFSTVKKTYYLRDKIFKTKTSRFVVLVNFLCLKFYRKYYFENNFLLSGVYLVVSVIFRPDKALRKVIGAL